MPTGDTYKRIQEFLNPHSNTLSMQYLALYIAYEIWARQITGEVEGRRIMAAMRRRGNVPDEKLVEWYNVRCLIVHGEPVNAERVMTAHRSLSNYFKSIVDQLKNSKSWHVDQPEIARYILML